MKNVFDRILLSRPETFTVFTPTVPVKEMGTGPLQMSVSSATFTNGKHVVPGGRSTVLSEYSSIFYQGNLFTPLLTGGQFSIETVLVANNDLLFTVASISGFINARIGRNASGDSYAELKITGVPGMTAKSIVIDLEDSGGAMHLAVGLNGDEISLIVNGVRSSIPLEDEDVIALDSINHSLQSASVTVPPSGMIWGVVVRSTLPTQDYYDEIADLITNFPSVEDAEEKFAAESFVFSRDRLNSLQDFNLEDLEFEDLPSDSEIYNGAETSAIEIGDTMVHARMNIPDGTDIESILSYTRGFNFSMAGDVADYDPELNQYSPMVSIDGTQATPWLPEYGEPEIVGVVDSRSYSSPDVYCDIKTFGPLVTLASENAPDRTATLDPTSYGMIGPSEIRTMRGGVYTSSSTGISIDPDANVQDPSEYPYAYGMWVYIPDVYTGTLRLAGSAAVTISVDASRALVSSGTSGVWIDGASYTSGPVAPGWHFITFIPSVRHNDVIYLGGNSKVVIYSFSMYHLENPSSYMSNVYLMHVEPPAVEPTTPDSFSINDNGVRVYAHNWSISSAD